MKIFLSVSLFYPRQPECSGHYHQLGGLLFQLLHIILLSTKKERPLKSHGKTQDLPIFRNEYMCMCSSRNAANEPAWSYPRGDAQAWAASLHGKLLINKLSSCLALHHRLSPLVSVDSWFSVAWFFLKAPLKDFTLQCSNWWLRKEPDISPPVPDIDKF